MLNLKELNKIVHQLAHLEKNLNSLKDQAHKELEITIESATESYNNRILHIEECAKAIQVIRGERQSANITNSNNSVDLDVSQRALKRAIKEIGVTEKSHKNDGPRIAYYQENLDNLVNKNQPWCASFVSRMFLDAYEELKQTRPFVHICAAAKFYSLAQQKNWEILTIPKPGSLFFVNLNSNGTYADHIGFVREYLATQKKIVTVEGNCSDSVKSRELELSKVSKYFVYIK